MTNKNKPEKWITLLAYILFIISISTFPMLLFTKYLRNNKHLFICNGTTQATDFEYWLLVINVTILFVILPILLIKITEYKQKYNLGAIVTLLPLSVYIISSLCTNKGEINNYIAICIYLCFIIVVHAFVQSIIAIYNWLWTEKTENGVNKKEIEISKVALLWTILTTILGILFGVKK